MSLWRLALAYLRHRLLATSLQLALMALGVATIIVLLLLGQQLQDRLARETKGVDLVVGAKGSPLQLILSAVFQIDAPTGNIPLAEAEVITRHPMVAKAIPLAMGDNARGFRVVGTEATYLDQHAAAIALGRLWQEPMEAVLGAEVARATGLGLEAELVSSHGLSEGGLGHGEEPYRIVGILAPTGRVIDRLVLTSIESIWDIHSPHQAATAPAPPREITALLVKYRTPLAAVQLPRLVNAQPSLLAAAPAIEATRLYALMGVGLDIVRLFGIVLMLAAATGLLVTLLDALTARRVDVALMRALGASPGLVFREMLLEALILSTIGLALGLLLGHGLVEALARLVPEARLGGITGLAFVPAELYLVAAVPVVGLLAAALPAFLAYRTDPAAELARGS